MIENGLGGIGQMFCPARPGGLQAQLGGGFPLQLPPGDYESKIVGIDFGPGPDRTMTVLLDYQGRVVDVEVVSQEEEAEMADAVNLEVFMDLNGQGVTVHEGKGGFDNGSRVTYHYFTTIGEATTFMRKHMSAKLKTRKALDEAWKAVEDQKQLLLDIKAKTDQELAAAKEKLQALEERHKLLLKRVK